jgi:hypothetical protein
MDRCFSFHQIYFGSAELPLVLRHDLNIIISAKLIPRKFKPRLLTKYTARHLSARLISNSTPHIRPNSWIKTANRFNTLISFIYLIWLELVLSIPTLRCDAPCSQGKAKFIVSFDLMLLGRYIAVI